MILDILVGIIILGAFRTGYKKGLIFMALFLVGIVIGVLSALKLSFITTEFIEQSLGYSAFWIPIVSFIINFVIAFWLCRLLANGITSFLKLVWLNSFNKLGGGVIAALLCFSLISIFLWYLSKLNVISGDNGQKSQAIMLSQSYAPLIIQMGSEILPVFRHLFQDLSRFFEDFSNKMILKS